MLDYIFIIMHLSSKIQKPEPLPITQEITIKKLEPELSKLP